MTAYQYTAPYEAYYIEYGIHATPGLVVDLPDLPLDGHWVVSNPAPAAAPAAPAEKEK